MLHNEEEDCYSDFLYIDIVIVFDSRRKIQISQYLKAELLTVQLATLHKLIDQISKLRIKRYYNCSQRLFLIFDQLTANNFILDQKVVMLKKNSQSQKLTLPSSKSLNICSKRPITSLQRIRTRLNNQALPMSKPKNPVTSRRVSINTTNNFFNPRAQKSQKSNYFNQLLSNPQTLNAYSMMSHIGKGCFSVVHLAVHRISGKHYAIKAYEKIDTLEWYRLQNLKREIINLQKLRHPNVVGLIDTVKDKQKIYLIMGNGGKQSLSGLLRKHKKFSQNQVKFYFKQILNAMAYCHQNGVCHRDLKLQNILVDDEGNVKIIDFGFSHRTNKKMSTYCGTPPYMCPEIIKKIPYFGAVADIWALGVLFYLMLFGIFPFRASNEQQLYRLIQLGKYQLKSQISNGAKDFLSRMLQVSPTNRATASQLLNSKWLS